GTVHAGFSTDKKLFDPDHPPKPVASHHLSAVSYGLDNSDSDALCDCLSGKSGAGEECSCLPVARLAGCDALQRVGSPCDGGGDGRVRAWCGHRLDYQPAILGVPPAQSPKGALGAG